MARTKLELVERIYDRLLAGDDALFFESLAPDVAWDETGGPTGEVFPDGAVLRGVPELRRFLRHWVGSWDEIRWHPRDFQDARNDVIVTVDIWGRGRKSGVEVQHTRHQVWTLRDGKVVRFKSFLTRDEALAAVAVSK
jgi:ketosteroid isomerase-like protein